ncbi:unnamed protein product [Prunus armeniaca]
MFFSPNTPMPFRTQLHAILGVNTMMDPGKYLGLSTMWGRLKKDAMCFVKDRILSKVQGWRQNLLS